MDQPPARLKTLHLNDFSRIGGCVSILGSVPQKFPVVLPRQIPADFGVATGGVRASQTNRPASELTCKTFLTYSADMVATHGGEHDVFGAISHPARRRMLDLLVETDRSVNAIAGHFRMSRPAVSQHLRVLLDAGLVTERRHGRERLYHLVPERLGPVRDWITHYERFWDDRLQRLQNQLAKRSQDD